MRLLPHDERVARYGMYGDGFPDPGDHSVALEGG